MEPSRLGWGVRSAIMILAGLIVVVASIVLLASSADDAPTPDEIAAESCSDLVRDVGRPASTDAADEAITQSAAEAGFEVKRDEVTKEETVSVADDETVLRITVTTWTVTDADDDVATFTWTSEASLPTGKFSAGTCTDDETGE